MKMENVFVLSSHSPICQGLEAINRYVQPSPLPGLPLHFPFPPPHSNSPGPLVSAPVSPQDTASSLAIALPRHGPSKPGLPAGQHLVLKLACPHLQGHAWGSRCPGCPQPLLCPGHQDLAGSPRPQTSNLRPGSGRPSQCPYDNVKVQQKLTFGCYCQSWQGN